MPIFSPTIALVAIVVLVLVSSAVDTAECAEVGPEVPLPLLMRRSARATRAERTFACAGWSPVAGARPDVV